jgi:hypothetical protein
MSGPPADLIHFIALPAQVLAPLAQVAYAAVVPAEAEEASEYGRLVHCCNRDTGGDSVGGYLLG